MLATDAFALTLLAIGGVALFTGAFALGRSDDSSGLYWLCAGGTVLWAAVRAARWGRRP